MCNRPVSKGCLLFFCWLFPALAQDSVGIWTEKRLAAQW